MKPNWAVAIGAGPGAASGVEFVYVVASWAGNPGFEHLDSKFAMPYAIFTFFLEGLRRKGHAIRQPLIFYVPAGSM